MLLRLGIIELVVSPVIAILLIVLVEKGDNVNDSLWVLFLLLFSDAVCLECSLPLLR